MVSPQEIEPSLQAGKAHLAVAWLPLPTDNTQKATPAILQSTDVRSGSVNDGPLNDSLAFVPRYCVAQSRRHDGNSWLVPAII